MIWAPKIVDEGLWKTIDFITVECDREFDRGRPECMGWYIEYRGRLRKIVGVDRNVPAFPIRVGERIGLLLDDVQPGFV